MIGAVACQDIKAGHMQQIVNAAPTAGEGDRVHRMISALVSAGINGGYLVNPRLAKVHWQAGGRPLPAPAVSVAGESALWVDPAEIPSDDDVAKLGLALAAGLHGERDELMASTAAYSGLRWGELAALTIAQVDAAARVITVDRKVVEVGGQLYPRGAQEPQVPPDHLPAAHARPGYPLAERLAARIEAARAEQEAGTNPLGLVFPSPKGRYWRSSNFSRASSSPPTWPPGGATLPARARGPGTRCGTCSAPPRCSPGSSTPTDVSRMAGHANYRITLDMYVGTTAGVLDRARAATE